MYDVIVVGAGPGGCAAAYHAARRGCRTLIVDQATFPRAKTCGDALSERSLSALRRMGVDSLPGYQRTTLSAEYRTPTRRRDFVIERSAFVTIPRVVLDELLLAQAIAAGATHMTATVVAIEAGLGGRLCRTVVLGAHGETTILSGVVICACGHRGFRRLRRKSAKRERLYAVAGRTYLALPRDDARRLTVHLPLPGLDDSVDGYGWVFPTDAEHANVGAGFVVNRGAEGAKLGLMLRTFLRDVQLDAWGKVPHAEGSRIEIATIPLEVGDVEEGGNVLFVGDAAGLASPLTAEGIAPALESGELAAIATSTCPRAPGESYKDLLGCHMPFSFRARGHSPEIYDGMRLVFGRGSEVLEREHAPLGRSVRRIVLKSSMSLGVADSDESSNNDSLDALVASALLSAAERLHAFAREFFEDAVRHRALGYGRVTALAGAIRKAVHRSAPITESDVKSLVVLEAVAIALSLNQSLGQMRESEAWGNDTLAILIADTAHALALEQMYGGSAASAKQLSKLAYSVFDAALRGEVDTTDGTSAMVATWANLLREASTIGLPEREREAVAEYVGAVSHYAAATMSGVGEVALTEERGTLQVMLEQVPSGVSQCLASYVDSLGRVQRDEAGRGLSH